MVATVKKHTGMKRVSIWLASSPVGVGWHFARTPYKVVRGVMGLQTNPVVSGIYGLLNTTDKVKYKFENKSNQFNTNTVNETEISYFHTVLYDKTKQTNTFKCFNNIF